MTTAAGMWDNLHLAVLKRLFAAVAPAEIEAIVRTKPTGSYSRRVETMGPVIHKFIILPRHLLRGTFLVYFVSARGWRDGGMEGWRDGGMEGWRDGGMEGWAENKIKVAA